MDQETLRRFENGCIQEEAPACQSFCPLHMDARMLAVRVAEGKVNEARGILERYMPLPLVGGRLCEGPCMDHCRRVDLDQAVDLPLLERFCLQGGRAPMQMPLPSTGRRTALVGGGLSSLAAAWELLRKGHEAVLFHRIEPGGSLRYLPPDLLPTEILEKALDQLRDLKLVFEEIQDIPPDWLDRLTADFGAVFLGLDDPAQEFSPMDLGLKSVDLDEVTQGLREAGRERIFLALPVDRRPFIAALSAGKKAALSVDRVLAGVAPSAAREKEAIRPSRLWVNVEGEEKKPRVPPVDPLRPGLEEAVTEAGRCLLCRCLECLKKCVYLRHYHGYPKKYAREIYNNISTAFGIRTSNILVNSCAQCGLCAEICPNGVNLGAFCAQARLDMVADKHMPVSAHEFALEDMEFSNAPEASLIRPQPGGAGRDVWLFFPGCQLPASLPDEVEKLYVFLTRHLCGGVGLFLGCCGAPARWSGRPVLTGRARDRILAAWNQAGRPRMILACASCRLFFQAELPEIETVSLWPLLADLPCPEERAFPGVPALHDPCATRRDQPVQESVRAILQRIGQPWEELSLAGRFTRCCGYGGLAAQANPALGKQYALDRAGDTEKPLLAYCIMCRDRLRMVGHPAIHILELLFGTLQPSNFLSTPGISLRQENRLAFRRGVLQRLWGEESEETVMEFSLEIAPDLIPQLESSHILRSDLADALRQAATHGPLFVHPESGFSLTAFRPRQVTFWVEYQEKTPGVYYVRNAWRHRMAAPGVPGEGRESPASAEGFAVTGGRV